MDTTGDDPQLLDKSVIYKIQNTIQNPSGCQCVGQDSVIVSGLLAVLSSPDCSLVKTVLQILYKLATYPENRRFIESVSRKYDDALMTQLGKLLSNDVSYGIQELARNVFDLFQNPSHHNQKRHEQYKEQKGINRATPKKRRNSFFLGGVGNSKQIILQIKGMHDKDDKELIRQRLLTVKGVISFTIDEQKSRVSLRCKPDLKAETLANAIRNTMTMTAQQVVKNEMGEILVSFKSNNEASSLLETTLPEYPSDEEESPVKGNGNIEPVGKERSQTSWDFVNSVTSFLQNSFYW